MSAPSQPLLPDVEGFTATLRQRGVEPDAIVVDARGTIARAQAAGTSPAGEGTPGSRPSSSSSSSSSSTSPSSTSPSSGGSRRRLPLVAASPQASEIVVTGTLKRGGMGEVLLARQTSLGRDVAVKVQKRGVPERDEDLVVEARIAGNLEHPNIVPVHVLGADVDGRPMLVMKRVEGESWRELLKAGRDLDRDLRILLEVGQALEFAHSRGVAHCDVKPTNVMVGRFGEVYLVDWGIAVGFGDCAIPDVPHADTLHGVFGTPKYLAPEMALPGGRIDQRSDVFIVGAVLYELVAGRPLREGKKVEALLHQAHVAEPPSFPDDVDAEMQAICGRALAREPEARFQTMGELREALLTWQQHGAARVLIEEGRAQAQLLTDAIAGGASERDVRSLFDRCRFAFQTALRQWPDAGVARLGLDDATAQMVLWEVGRGELSSAQALLATLSSPAAALREAVEGLAATQRERARAIDELERLATQQDRHVAEQERAHFVFGSGLAWLATMVGLDVATGRGLFITGPGVFAVFMGLFAATLVVAGLAAPGLRRTDASRGMWLTMIACVVGLATTHGIGWRLGLDAATMLPFGHVVLAVTAAQLAAHDRRLWPAAIMAGLIVPALLLAPARVLTISGVGGFLILTDIARQWRRPPTPGTGAR